MTLNNINIFYLFLQNIRKINFSYFLNNIRKINDFT